jgi:hypothetical protein
VEFLLSQPAAFEKTKLRYANVPLFFWQCHATGHMTDRSTAVEKISGSAKQRRGIIEQANPKIVTPAQRPPWAGFWSRVAVVDL